LKEIKIIDYRRLEMWEANMDQQIKIYIASPLGFSEVGREFMYTKIIPLIEDIGYQVINPWKLTDYKLIKSVLDMPYGEAKKKRWEELNFILGRNNVEAIKNSSGLFVVLDGVDVDSGTASEIGYAAAFGKPILGYRGDFRLSADNEGSIVNLQVEYFIKMNGGKIITQIADLDKELREIFPLKQALSHQITVSEESIEDEYIK